MSRHVPNGGMYSILSDSGGLSESHGFNGCRPHRVWATPSDRFERTFAQLGHAAGPGAATVRSPHHAVSTTALSPRRRLLIPAVPRPIAVRLGATRTAGAVVTHLLLRGRPSDSDGRLRGSSDGVKQPLLTAATAIRVAVRVNIIDSADPIRCLGPALGRLRMGSRCRCFYGSAL